MLTTGAAIPKLAASGEEVGVVIAIARRLDEDDVANTQDRFKG